MHLKTTGCLLPARQTESPRWLVAIPGKVVKTLAASFAWLIALKDCANSHAINLPEVLRMGVMLHSYFRGPHDARGGNNIGWHARNRTSIFWVKASGNSRYTTCQFMCCACDEIRTLEGITPCSVYSLLPRQPKGALIKSLTAPEITLIDERIISGVLRLHLSGVFRLISLPRF